MDLGRVLRERLKEAFESGLTGEGATGANVAAAVNVNAPGHVTSVYSDSHVTIIQRDGKTEVIRHNEPGPGQEDEKDRSERYVHGPCSW